MTSGAGEGATDRAPAVPGSATPSLTVRAVSKTFSGNTVLDNVDLDLRAGEVHALLGHNGSGKSTLIKVLAGVYLPNPGASMVVREQQVDLRSPADSYRAGLRFVHQRLTLVDELSAADNLALGSPFATKGRFIIDWAAQTRAAREVLESFGARTGWDPRRPLGEAPPIVRTQFAIGRALHDLEEGGVLVLDEPTASLAPAEVEQLFSIIADVTRRGVAVLYVTHRLREVYEIADRITLLRDGRSLGTHTPDELPMGRLVDLLAGNDQHGDNVAEATPPAAAAPSHPARTSAEAPAAFVVEGLHSAELAGIDLQARPGEILGVCGLAGSGRESIARALTGAIPSTVTRVSTSAGEATALDLRQAGRLGIILARESRASGALIDEMTIRENLSLPVLRERVARGGVIRRDDERRLAREWVAALDVKPPLPETVMSTMSGGNRQKVVIAKALLRSPEVLVLDDPTAGVDVGAAASLHAMFRQLADEGKAVILVSSDLQEVCQLADRAVVLSDGRISARIDVRSELTEPRILAATA